MEAAEDPYAILGVDPGASAEEIHSAFRRLALQHHPDRSPGSQARMVAINRAYSLLRDPERRQLLDAGRRDDPLESQPEKTWFEAVDADDEEAWLWADDLERHADDWRQMYEEERMGWEHLLSVRTPDAPDRAAIEASLRRTRTAQLALENAVRAREGLTPLAPAEFDQRREAGRKAAAGHTVAAGGCFTLVAAAGLIGLIGSRAHLARR